LLGIRATVKNTFTGGSGTNTFNIKSATTNHDIEDLKGSDVLTVSTGDTNVGIKVTADFTATAATTNSSNNNDDVILSAQSAGVDINMSSATVATGFTLNGSSGAEALTGSTQADAIVGGAGNDTLSGGGGADVINGGVGVDSITGGGGADDFSLASAINAAAAVETDIITDFKVADTDQVGNIDVTNIKTQALVTDVIDVGDTTDSTGAEAIGIQFATGATDMKALVGVTAGLAAKNVLSLQSSTAFTEASVADALEASGSHEFKFNGIAVDKDAMIIVYDNNVNTFIAQAVLSAGVADGAAAAAGKITVNNLATLNSVSDSSTVVAGNFLDFLAS
jgi:hypothetical protein